MMKIINEALEDILKHRTTSMLLACIIAVAVFISAMFMSLVYNLDTFKTHWSKNVRLYAFTAESTDLNLIQDEVKKINGVISAERYGAEEAVQVLKKRFPDQDIAFSSTIVPTFIEVKVDAKNLQNVKGVVEKIGGVEEVVVNSSWFDNLSKLISLVKYVATAVILLLLIMALIMIAYASRIGVFERRPEISLMRLCGATEWRLRTPYIFSGIILGFIGGGIGISAYMLLRSFIQGTTVVLMSSWQELPLLQILILYIASIIVGATGNLAAFFRGSYE